MRVGNRILDALDGPELESFMRLLTPVRLERRDVIGAPGERLADVYFPRGCVLSSTLATSAGVEVEVAAVGSEGFYPMTALAGTEPGVHRTVCQVAGAAYRIPAEDFVARVGSQGPLLLAAQRFAQSCLHLMSQSVACNRLHPLVERSARWLLALHDRVPGDELRITREYFSVMLGVRFPAGDVAARALRDAGLIAYGRSAITVLDRSGLEAASCECYAALAPTSGESGRTKRRRTPSR
jgi:CRP-like cAMP-binding protein